MEKAHQSEELRERILKFKSSARAYLQEKEQMRRLEESGYAGSLREESTRRGTLPREAYYAILREDIRYVENVLERIEALYGSHARMVVMLVYVRQNTIASVAESLGLTSRQLRYSLDKWLNDVL